VKTKICEKYSVKNDTWERIAMMHQARSRTAACLFDRKFIYVFFGTNSYGNNVRTIERYDIEKNQWDIVEPVNQIPGIETTCGAAVQINSHQIILFGGFADSSNYDDVHHFQRKIIIFNTDSMSYELFSGFRLPADFL